jgi:hypothetical protein
MQDQLTKGVIAVRTRDFGRTAIGASQRALGTRSPLAQRITADRG